MSSAFERSRKKRIRYLFEKLQRCPSSRQAQNIGVVMKTTHFCIIIYIAKNFTIRDILFLDSEFILRKFDTKGHTIFLKDQDVASYFFSRSDKHFDKVVNKMALLKFATPALAIKLEDRMK